MKEIPDVLPNQPDSEVNLEEEKKFLQEMKDALKKGDIQKCFNILHSDMVRTNKSLNDKIFYDIVSFSREDPKVAGNVLHLLGSDIEYISPDLVQKIIVELSENPPEIDVVSSSLVHAAVYNIKYKTKYLEKILEQINFTHPEHFVTSARTLNFLWRVLSASSGNDYSKDNVGRIIEALEKEAEKPEANYFLKKYADIILSLKGTSVSFQALNSMTDSDYNNDKDIDLQELLPVKDKVDERDLQRVENDFKFVTSPFFSEMLKDDMGLNIKDFSINEQFYILEFLQKIPYQDIDKIKKFNEKFSIDGFKTFLSYSIHKEICEVIGKYFIILMKLTNYLYNYMQCDNLKKIRNH